MDKFSEQLNTQIHIGGVDVAFFNKVILEDIWIESQQKDTLAYTSKLIASIDSFSIKKNFISFNNILFDKPVFNVAIDSIQQTNFQFLIDSINTKNDTSGIWRIYCNSFKFNDANFQYKNNTRSTKEKFSLTDVNFNIENIKSLPDSLSFNLIGLTLKGPNNFLIKNFGAQLELNSEKLFVNNIKLVTPKSNISNANFEILKNNQPKNEISRPEFNLNFKKARLSFEDLTIFAPALKGMNQDFQLSGNIYGSLEDLKGRNISIKTGNNTSAEFNFYINGLPDIENVYLFFDLNHFQTDFNDLSDINLPKTSALKKLSFPTPFYDAGLITYVGNFTGFLSDFVSYGTLNSEMGEVSTDLSFIPGGSGKLKIDGNISTSNFELGNLYKIKKLKEISFEGEIEGEYDKKNRLIQGIFAGIVSKLDFNNYSYSNINIDGLFENKNFDGFININDPNLKLDFNGKLNLNPKIPEFDFDLSLRQANLNTLNFNISDSNSALSFITKAKFNGNNIDNLNGYINIENGSYRNNNGEITFRNIKLSTKTDDNNRELAFNSDFFDATINGFYNLRTLPATFKYILSTYLPAIDNTKIEFKNQNQFDYIVDIKNMDEIISVFIPNIKLETPFTAQGNIDTDNNQFFLHCPIPGITSENFAFRDILLSSKTNDRYSAKVKIGELHSKSGLSLYNIAINTEAKNNHIKTKLTWNNFDQLSYSGEISTQTTLTKNATNTLGANIEVLPTKIYIADSLWHIEPSTIKIDSTAISINNFTFHGNNQVISVDGKISNDSTDRLSVSFKDIYLEQIETYLQKEKNLTGIINGKIELENLYGKKLLYSDINIAGLFLKGQELGNVTLTNKWDNETSAINTELIIEKNNRNQLYANGYYYPEDRNMMFNANFDHLSLVILETIIRKNLSNFHGDAVGQVKIHGKPDNILIDGAIMGKNAGLTIDYTQVSYHFSDTVNFVRNKIIFDHITINDVLKNTGTFNGSISHKNFQNMTYDLEINSPKILAMHTSPKNNGLFYGNVIADGSFSVKGKGVNVNLEGTGRTLLGTDVNISLDYGNEAEQYDFIQFVKKDFIEEEKIIYTSKKDTATNLNLTIEVTPDAKAQLIYNSKIGDIIRGKGKGILRFGMDKQGEITLYGTYDIEQGDYLFTLQNIINKKFTIEQGGSIAWNGDPYNAIIDIDAAYKLKASLYELFVNSYQNIDYTQRIPVHCKILLTEDLLNPTINFDIDFPLVEDRIVDELQQFFNTDEEMNRQILSLLVLGQFYTPEYMRGSYEATSSNLIGTTASELFSNQLSNWLSQISNDFDVGLNYRPGSQLTNDEIELALSTQIFNDRVTLNGNIGNNVNPNSNNNSQIIGDFDLNVKLTNNGKVQLKAFSRSNNNLIYETAPYTQGIGFTITEEYNTFEELLQKLLKLFKRKSKD